MGGRGPLHDATQRIPRGGQTSGAAVAKLGTHPRLPPPPKHTPPPFLGSGETEPHPTPPHPGTQLGKVPWERARLGRPCLDLSE